VGNSDSARLFGVGIGTVAAAESLNSSLDQAIIARIKRASITEAKNRLSALIDGLKGGSPVLIVDRGRPVARLEPVTGGDSNQDGRLSRLVREGVVRQGRTSLARGFFKSDPPRQKKGASALPALIEERREGR